MLLDQKLSKIFNKQNNSDQKKWQLKKVIRSLNFKHI